MEANYLAGNIKCLAISIVNLHPKGAFLLCIVLIVSVYCISGKSYTIIGRVVEWQHHTF